MKKIYLLPNLLTTANMFCGFYSIVSAIHGNFSLAAWSIMIAIIFDTMDGRVARLTRATSSFGVEYDSLSDLLSFGVAPAVVTYLWCLIPFGRLGWLAAFLYIVCTALRLARFNIRIGLIPKQYFQGAPSPLAAATLATAVIFYFEMEQEFAWLWQAIPKEVLMLGLTFLMASLMISTIRFPSFKEFRIKKENSFGVLSLGVLMFLLVAVKPEVTLFSISIFYIVLALVLELYRILFRRRVSHSETVLTAKTYYKGDV